jgi:hypothetical protein
MAVSSTEVNVAGLVLLWDIPTLPGDGRARRRSIYQVAFSPDDRHLAASLYNLMSLESCTSQLWRPNLRTVLSLINS